MKAVLSFVAIVGSFAAVQTVVPVENEPQHHLAFENALIKVLSVAFPPGYVSLFHQHSLHNVSVRIVTGATRTDLLDAEGTLQVAPVGRVLFNSASPPYTHRVANLSTTTIRIVDVELLGAKSSPDERAPDNLAGHAIVIENEHVRATRIQLSAGASLAAHTHPRGWLEIVVTGRDPGHFSWHNGGSPRTAVSGTATPIELVEIEPR